MNLFRLFRGQGETPLAMKIILMVAGSLALGLALGFADPDNTRLMPSFSDHLRHVLSSGPQERHDEEGISVAIAAYNRDLARAYLEMDAAVIAAIPLDGSLRQNCAEEIAFLKEGGRVLDLAVGNIVLTKVSRLPNGMLSASTIEPVRIRYLNAKDRAEIVSYPVARYAMRYTLERIDSGWKIVRVETMGVGKHDE